MRIRFWREINGDVCNGIKEDWQVKVLFAVWRFISSAVYLFQAIRVHC